MFCLELIYVCLVFYWFVDFWIKKDLFIHNYTQPIIENGVQLRDMVMLWMVLCIAEE